MPEPDCFLRYRISAATRKFITSGKSHVWVLAAVAAARRGFKWFYSPRAVGTPLSEEHALYLVHFTFYFRPSYEKKQLFGNATDTHSGCMSKLLQFPLYRQSLPGVETGKWRCLFPVLLSITFLVRYFLWPHHHHHRRLFARNKYKSWQLDRSVTIPLKCSDVSVTKGRPDRWALAFLLSK